jgi:hypothetical protein
VRQRDMLKLPALIGFQMRGPFRGKTSIGRRSGDTLSILPSAAWVYSRARFFF